MKKQILLGVSGGIACYKALDVVSQLRQKKQKVQVVLTQSAEQFVSPLSFQTLSEQKVARNLFEPNQDSRIEHIHLAQSASLLAVVPATANILAKLAAGIADDLLSTIALATDAPLLVAPAMNNQMWQHLSVQHNLGILAARGVTIIPPEPGFLACGSYGIGRLANIENILLAIEQAQKPEQQLLVGCKVLVTAGPTVEALDPSKFLSNHSSGKMGFALAQECVHQGAEVFLVSGPVNLPTPVGVQRVNIMNSEQMADAVFKLAKQCQFIFQAAAVADYRPTNPSTQKLKKQKLFSVELEPTQDILLHLGQTKQAGQVVVGFAAETHNLLEYAQQKRVNKKVDLIVANLIQDLNPKNNTQETQTQAQNLNPPAYGFKSDTNCGILLDAEQTTQLPLMSKRQMAKKIVERAVHLKKPV